MGLPRKRAVARLARRRVVRDLGDDAPETPDEAAPSPRRSPRSTPCPRSHGRGRGCSAGSVGAVALDEVVRTRRRCRPASRSSSCRAVTQPFEKTRERLAEAEQSEVVQHLHPEARVDHVHRRVVDAADVAGRSGSSSRRRPDRTARCRSAGRSTAGSTRTSRRRCPSSRSRASQGLHTTGTARSPSPRPARAAGRPSACSPRSPGGRPQLALRHRDDAGGRVVDDRDRAAPGAALSPEAPVAQAEVDREAAPALGGELPTIARPPSRVACRRTPPS